MHILACRVKGALVICATCSRALLQDNDLVELVPYVPLLRDGLCAVLFMVSRFTNVRCNGLF